MCRLLNVVPDQVDAIKQAATIPLCACWASWADSLPIGRERHPAVANTIVARLEEHPHTTCLNAAADVADRLAEVPGFVVPSWSALARGVRPPPRGPEDFEPGAQLSGWQLVPHGTGLPSGATLPTSLGQ